MNKILNPLRYPGSKAKLSNNIVSVLNFRPNIFIEPFCGGASVALKVLELNLADKIALIDKDQLIISFWRSVFFNANKLIQEIENLQIDLSTWDNIKKSNPTHEIDMAIKCLFLNRTNFSGIIKGGMLGGRR